MSKTDKTRPWRINEADPLNRRFMRVSQYDWFYKRMGDVKGCWCCSQKRHYANEQRSQRGKQNRECRDLARGGWRDET